MPFHRLNLSKLSSRSRVDKKFDDPEERKVHGEVLEKYWLHFVGFAWVQFIAFEAGLTLDKHHSNNPLCPYSDHDYPKWFWYCIIACLGGFIMIWLVLFFKIVTISAAEQRTPLVVALNIVTMGTIATILSAFDDPGVCIDILGVASPGPIWGEWISCGPLLIIITLAIVNKPEFNRLDWFLIISFWLCLITGFFIIIPQTYEAGMFWFLASCLTYLPVLYLPWYEASVDPSVTATANEDATFKIVAARFAQRYNLSMWLTIVLPLYTVNYIVAMAGGFGPAETIAIYQILSVLTKGLFAAATMDIHLGLMVETEKALLEERRANEARRQFMRFIFHEVRTPLNSLTMGIDMIGSSPNIDHQDKESLDIMRSASNFMSKTLDGVLSMHKIEDGKFEIEPTAMDLKTLLHSTVNTFYGNVLRKDLQIVVVLSPKLPVQVLGDNNRLEHVLSNLLSNAIKFSPEGSTIVVSAVLDEEASSKSILHQKNGGGRFEVDDTAAVTIAVEDRGPGIDAEHLEIVFHQFVQIRPSTLQSGQGSGLGLSFCKNIVTLHGGTITATSKGVGQGSTFKFTIPFKVVTAGTVEGTTWTVGRGHKLTSTNSAQDVAGLDDIRPPSATSSQRVTTHESADLSTGSSSGSGSKSGSGRASKVSPNPHPAPPSVGAVLLDRAALEVLVVDDADSNRKILLMLLKRKNINCIGAENGRVAVEMVEKEPHRFKLILMDNLMPVLNGVDAARELRERLGFPHIIAGITGNVTDNDVFEYLEGGADLVLPKPLKVEMIESLLVLMENQGPVSRWSERHVITLDASSGDNETVKKLKWARLLDLKGEPVSQLRLT